jgi:hypothetical protein
LQYVNRITIFLVNSRQKLRYKLCN